MGFNPIKNVVDVVQAPFKMIGGNGGLDDMWDDFTGASGIEDANEKNLQIAREQMAFQERMSNTAHVREVADLRKAGLNPILSANSGASTPSGSAPTMLAKPGSKDSIMSLLSLVSLFSSVSKNAAEVKATDASAAKTLAEINNVVKSNRLLDAQIEATGASAKSTALDLSRKEVTQRYWDNFKKVQNVQDKVNKMIWESLLKLTKKKQSSVSNYSIDSPYQNLDVGYAGPNGYK